MNTTPEPSASHLSPSFSRGKIKKNRTERRERKIGNGKTGRTREKWSCFGEGAVHSHSLAPNSHPFSRTEKLFFHPKSASHFHAHRLPVGTGAGSEPRSLPCMGLTWAAPAPHCQHRGMLSTGSRGRIHAGGQAGSPGCCRGAGGSRLRLDVLAGPWPPPLLDPAHMLRKAKK